MKLLRKMLQKLKIMKEQELEFINQALQQIRGDQVTDSAISGKHLSTDAYGSIRKNIASNDSVGVHINGYASATQSIPMNTWTKLQWGDIKEDKLGNYDSINHGFTIPYNGIYIFTSAIRWEAQSDAVNNILAIYINGIQRSTLNDSTVSAKGNSTTWSTMSSGADIGRVAAGDFIEFYVYTTEDSTIRANDKDSRFNCMQLV